MRGQAAFEYMVLFSIALLLLGILVWYSQEVTEANRGEIIVANSISALNKIVEASNIVYTQGKPSQITISVYIPEKISSIEFNGNLAIIKISTEAGISDIIAKSKAPFCCLEPCSNTQYCIPPDSGMKKIKVIAEENYVNVTES